MAEEGGIEPRAPLDAPLFSKQVPEAIWSSSSSVLVEDSRFELLTLPCHDSMFPTISIPQTKHGALGGIRTRKNLASKTSSCANLHKSPGQISWWLWLVSIQPPRLMRAVRIRLRHTTNKYSCETLSKPNTTGLELLSKPK
jgi:hypothetical protein